MVDHPAKFGNVMKTLLSRSGRHADEIQRSAVAASQKRGMHIYRRVQPPTSAVYPLSAQQRRSLRLRADQSVALLKEYGTGASDSAEDSLSASFLGITIDRTARSPCILVSPTTSESSVWKRSLRIPFNYRRGPSQSDIQRALSHLHLDAAPPMAKAQAATLLSQLWRLFHEKEAISLYTHISPATETDRLIVTGLDFTFDDAAFRSSQRHPALHALRDTSLADPTELAAESAGIVYIKLDGADRDIGTLVNGAGLAMNTIDALAAHGGRAANFLDTGGKATSETVKRSFELILRDRRVKVIFVNVFGGLTLGDMIAEGILLAFRELDVGSKVPVVVRIRGTNEEEGQRIIRESGLELFAFDDFEEAARKVVELANMT